ncbi:MAG TPA: glycosyltransferase family 4 protein [Longimicrobiales bacterium]|nr:glycosyltransferase family 4 protein [Longimicrobiales bacterium]
MRVLHFIYDDPQNPWVGGGGAVRAFEICRRLTDRADITIVTGRFPGARDETVDGVHYRRLGARAPYAWSRLTYSAAATRLLARADYDAAVFDFSAYTALRFPRGRPVGITVHHLSGASARERWGAAASRIIGALEVRRLRQARVFSATSQAMHDELRTLVREDADIHRVQAGVPDHLFALPHRESDYLLYFGRLDWFHKGLDIVLDAFAILVQAWPHVRLRIAGRGRDAARVAEAVAQRGIGGSVDLLGAVSDDERDRLFAGARAMLMPSRFEGFGLAAAEAMAAGVPVVASDAGSLPEVLDAPHGGIVVPHCDAHSFARAVDALLHDDAARAALGDGARAAAGRFRWDAVAQRHLEFLSAIQRSADGP